MNKHGHLLQQDLEVKKVFNHLPFVTFRTGYSFKNRLVRAKLPIGNREVGSSKCRKKACMVCKNVTETETFQSSVTKKNSQNKFQVGL